MPSKHAGKKWTGTQRMTDGLADPHDLHRRSRQVPRHDLALRHEQQRRQPHQGQAPATFPDALARDLILALSAPGEVVYDPMTGSGTSVVVAAQEGRRWLGNDYSAEYVDIASERLSAEANVPLVHIVSTCCECGNDDVCEGYFYCSDCLEAVGA